jgi:transcriptional regulator with XRE-family HTH domain
MKPTAFDLKIIKVVKELRISNCLGQKNIADILHLDQSTYCRIEKGETAFTHGQLRTIAQLFKTNHLHIIQSVEQDE